MTMKVRKAIFPAAGLGTRFLPATKAQPKEMLPLVDKPIIQYGVEEALAAGCDQIIIITGRGKSAIEDHFDVSYELESQPLDQHAPITSVTVSGARPAIRTPTKRTVLLRYSQQPEVVSGGTTLNRGYVWRHIIPYATLATRLEAGLAGQTHDEAHQWLTDNRSPGAPQEDMPADTLSPLAQLQERAHSWLDGWQNNPANLFIGLVARVIEALGIGAR